MTRNPNQPPRRIRPATLALAVAIVLAAAGSGWYLQASAKATTPPAADTPPPAMPVTVASALTRRVVEWDEFSGRLEAIERIDVRSRVAGYIESVHFEPGTMVAKGATLFVIDPKPFAAEVARAEAVLAAAQARLALTGTELARARSLLEDHAISQREFDQRQNAHLDAQASLQAAQATLHIARLNLGYTQIKAPISGRVSRAEVTAGNLIAAGAEAAALTTIVSTSPIYATFEADEQSFLKFSLRPWPPPAGARRTSAVPIRMGLANEEGHPRTGRIEFVDNALDPQSGTIRVRAVFDNPDGRLAPGLFARLQVGGGEREAVLIDDRAVGTDQSKKFVFVVDADQQVSYREVRLGPLVDGLRVVREGLQPGESIVVVGVQRVRPGMQVAASKVPMDPRARTATAAPLAQAQAGARS